jgi:RNA polymerase sigma-70 factor, ECF subfamily
VFAAVVVCMAVSTGSHPESPEVAAAIGAGDEVAFVALAERYRRQLHVHCYRMLGSLEDSEDLVQETVLRAWRRRTSFEGRSSFRAWLYRIATNACLDFLERRPARVLAPDVIPGVRSVGRPAGARGASVAGSVPGPPSGAGRVQR